MNFEKAKKITIVFLLIVNVLLFSLNQWKASFYQLDETRKSNIVRLLAEKNIVIDPDLLKAYPSMTYLELRNKNFDIDFLQPEMIANHQISYELNHKIYANKEEEISVWQNKIFYRRMVTDPNFMENPIVACQELLTKINPILGQYKPHSIQKMQSDGYKIIFYEQFEKINILPNKAVIILKENGVFSAEIVRYAIKSYPSLKRSLLPIDEVFVGILDELVNMKEKNSSLIIERIELVYDLTNSQTTGRINLTAVPFYKIFIANHSQAIVINAFTNELL